MIFKLIQCGIPYQHPTGALKSFIRAAQRATFYSGSEVIGYFWRQNTGESSVETERKIFSGENLAAEWNTWLDQIMAKRVDGSPYEIGFGYIIFRSEREALSWHRSRTALRAFDFGEVSFALQEHRKAEA
jgi:hypothetical protein